MSFSLYSNSNSHREEAYTLPELSMKCFGKTANELFVHRGEFAWELKDDFYFSIKHW